MKNFIKFNLLLSLLFSSIFVFGENNFEKIIAVGEQIAIPLKAIKQFSIGNETIISAKFDPLTGSLLVKGKKLGFSDIIIWEKHARQSNKYKFKVISRRSAGLEEDVRNALSEINGVKISLIGEKVIVDGEVNSIDDLLTIQKLGLGKNGFTNLVKLSKTASKKAIERFMKISKTLGFDQISTDYLHDQIIITGLVRTEDDRKKLTELADENLGFTKINVEIEADTARTLILDVYFLETSKTESEKLGIKWDISGGSSFAFPDFKHSADLLLKNSLDMSLKEGKSKILASPQIALKKGATSELLAGGEIPIKASNKLVTNIIWKQYGLSLKVNLADLTSKDAKLQINAEMSTLDTANAIDGLPGIKTNKMSTSLDAELDKTIFITGLVRQDSFEDSDKIPFIGNVPILGKLFTSTDYKNHKSELTIAIHPKLKTKVTKLWK